MVSPLLPSSSSSSVFTQKRARNLTSIHIKNLTPFPVRDAFASAITQQPPLHQPTFSGHFSDDIDITLARRRSRRVSVGSVRTLKSLRTDEDVEDLFSPPQSADAPERKRTTSARSGTGAVKSAHDQAHPPNSSRTNVPLRRRRTSSSSQTSPGARNHRQAQSGVSTLPLDNTQDALEKVVSSRLVDTFITIHIHSSSETIDTVQRNDTHSATSPKGPTHHLRPTGMQDGNPAETLRKSRHARALSVQSSPVATHKRTPSVPSGKQATSRSPSSARSVTENHIPSYISPVHRPSTNPNFSLNPTADFGPWSDLRSTKLKVCLYGRVGDDWPTLNGDKGKGKAVYRPDGDGTDSSKEFRILKEWIADLEDLVPAPEELPSNCLAFELNTTGELYCVPDHLHHQRPPPSNGYASDSELTSGGAVTDAAKLSEERHEEWERDTQPTARTASWEDLFKMATLQTCIVDHQTSLAEVTKKMDTLVLGGPVSACKRDVFERELRLSVLQSNLQESRTKSASLRDKIRNLRECIKDRRQLLGQAYEHQSLDIGDIALAEETIDDERHRLFTLRAAIPPTRTALLTTLSSIYPIELLSPPDLLYTILDAPLPIPLSSSDPAPPLHLPSHSSVTEEAVAAALGFAAQLLQLLAAYLRKGLVYPVTCVGSRSFVRDDISAMVGPRMFPLFTKGIDMYRFEYAVFLLNKNIEMLMIDRNLRALDVRHTLPNLKNLLLTLSDDLDIPVLTPRFSVASSLTSTLQGPSTKPPPDLLTDSNVEDANSNRLSTPSEEPPGSGSATPVATVDSRKSKSFLGGFTGFNILSHYYPKSTPSQGTSGETDANGAADVRDNGSDDDGEDRRTIRGLEVHTPLADQSTSPIDRCTAMEKVGQGQEATGHEPSSHPSSIVS